MDCELRRVRKTTANLTPWQSASADALYARARKRDERQETVSENQMTGKPSRPDVPDIGLEGPLRVICLLNHLVGSGPLPCPGGYTAAPMSPRGRSRHTSQSFGGADRTARVFDGTPRSFGFATVADLRSVSSEWLLVASHRTFRLRCFCYSKAFEPIGVRKAYGTRSNCLLRCAGVGGR